jgi:hypothetical protein
LGAGIRRATLAAFEVSMLGRGLLHRLRDRLGGRPAAAPIGLAFTADMVEPWMELEEEVDGSLKKAGTAVVGSWEVATTELARALVGAEHERTLIERFSDAAVPTLGAFQDLHKGCPSAFIEGRSAGEQKKTLAAATLPLVRLLVGLDGRAEAGWAKSTDYLEPVFALTADPAAAKAAFGAGGAELARACREADAVLRDTLSKLPQATSLHEGVSVAFDAWQLKITRELEIGIDRYTRPLVAAVRDARA